MRDSEAVERRVSRRSVLRGAVGGVGIVAAGSTVAVAQATASYGDWFTSAGKGGATTNFDGTTVDRRGESSVTVQVGANGNGGTFAFAPPAVRIDPGTTVTFEWVSDTHNNVVEEQPSGGDWSGHQAIENQGFSYQHTFQAEGIYKYYCQPHLPLGMKGAIVVGDVELAPAQTAGGGGGAGFQWPGGSAGVAFMAVLFGTAGLAVLVAAGGESLAAVRRWWAGAAEAAAEPLAEAEAEVSTVREIAHDDYDPFGTATLIVLYFLILLVMWVFVYFVEFLGRGPKVIG